MRIGFIDCDQKNSKNPFPNLCIMKLSAWHKAQGDTTEWYEEFTGEYDKVYVSKVFSFTPDYEYPINAKEVVYGGSGYAISMIDGREMYNKELDKPLPYEIEHTYPDYGLYGITDTAYGFISRGCPRGCDFCHVKDMQGRMAHKVTDLSEFWNGQKNIVLLDPNISACKDWKEIFQQLIDSKAYVDFSQGLDIRLMTDEKIEMLKKIKCKGVHFAWDRYEDRDIIVPKLKAFKQATQWDRRKIIVYVLCGDRERRITDHDLERIYTLREIGCWPYVMLYDKESLPRGHELKRLQRWVNNRIIWESTPTFEEYIIRHTKAS
ncbi:MAG: radical SAM protein [Lachnospiraceae bacterium]|nr:radical SAM protein [Lachnospiraceae bacterium]